MTMTNNPYPVTVGLPVYDVEPYIRRCLLSILNQTFPGDIEILVVDDRGKDRSMDIVRELQAEHPRGQHIRILTQPENRGCWAARNRVLEEAQGTYVMLVDADDYIAEDCIEKLYRQATEHQAEAVYGSVQTVDADGKVIDIGHHYLHQPYLVLEGDDALANYAYQDTHSRLRDFIWNVLFSRAFIERHHIRFKEAWFNDDMICSSDTIPLVRRAVLLPDITYYYVIRDNSLSNYQHRSVIRLEEIEEFIRIFSYLKNKCLELREKPYFEARCTKGMILMFYMICGVLKNRDRITPALDDRQVKAAMVHPLHLRDIVGFRRYRLLNLLFYVIGRLPAGLTVWVITRLGKHKHAL